MKALYFDTFAGISGDTTVAAMIDLGLPLDWLRKELGKLPLGQVGLTASKVMVGPISATRFKVEPTAQTVERTLLEIVSMLRASSLAAAVAERATKVFEALARAEGRVHGVAPEKVHFHEVGAIDSIADIVAACLGVEALGVKEFLVGSLPLGDGIVSSRHGPLPLPAPATVELLRGLPCQLGSGSGEMVTPTGAALLVGLGASPVTQAEIVIERVGYGAGSRQLQDRPNVLRLLLGELACFEAGDECEVLEANIDDLNPEFYGYISKRLLQAGALDVALLPIQMKKGRPGTLLSVVAPVALAALLSRIILEETSTTGLRFYRARRVKLERKEILVSTPHGEIRVKVVTRPGGEKTFAPEYDDCARAAAQAGVPLRLVYEAAAEAAKSQMGI